MTIKPRCFLHLKEELADAFRMNLYKVRSKVGQVLNDSSIHSFIYIDRIYEGGGAVAKNKIVIVDIVNYFVPFVVKMLA